jgi:hypothetical protein
MTPGDATEVVPFLSSAATIAFLQKMLKQTQPYAQFVQAFPGADKWAHRTFAAVASLFVALGIHLTWKLDSRGWWISAVHNPERCRPVAWTR